MSSISAERPLYGHPERAGHGAHAPAPRLHIESSPKRVRVELARHFVADTQDAKLVCETGQLPLYYFPHGDVRWELAVPTGHATRSPFKGVASFFTVQAGGKVAENAMWAYTAPEPEMAPLSGYVAFAFDRMDAVYEEDEKLLGHPHDPYHRVDVRRSSRRVRVLIDGELIAETTRPRAVFETGLAVRWYVPTEDVCIDRLEDAGSKTICPYKGLAMYRALRGRPGEVAWTFYRPLPEGSGLSGHLCFEGEGVVIEVGPHTR